VATRFEVNIDAILQSSEYIGSAGRRLHTLDVAMNLIVKTAMSEVFTEAIRVADEEDGFPIEFQNHTMSVINKFEGFTISLDNNVAFIGVDFDALGTQADLIQAFHQGSKLAEGGFLWGPYTGQALATEEDHSPEERHAFWEAIRFGHDKAVLLNGKTMPTNKAPYQWDEIVKQYVHIWGPDKCPEWLFIQYGQRDYEPTVPDYDIETEVGNKLNELAETLLVEFVEGQVEIANLYESAGINIGFTKRGQPRLSGGQRIGLLGKERLGGQFLPY